MQRTSLVLAAIALLIAAPSTVALAVAFGVAVCDIVVLRKSVVAGLVNTGREVIALVSAAGFYVLSLSLVQVTEISLDFMPAAAVLTGKYFLASRALFYFSLLVRSKLPLEERLFILREDERPSNRAIGPDRFCRGVARVIDVRRQRRI